MGNARTRARLGAIALIMAALGGCGGGAGESSLPNAVERVFPGVTLGAMTDIQSRPDQGGDERLFVVQKSGQVWSFDPEAAAPSPQLYLDVSALANFTSRGEQGLLGLAFDPDHASNGYFYVHLVKQRPRRVVIVRFRDDGTRPIDLTTAVTVLEADEYDSLDVTNHVAGGLAFGPVDGYLYLTMGDGGGSFDPDGAAQDRADLRGSILRIDTAGTTATGSAENYAIPPDNPLVGNTSGLREEIFAWGMRNPFRISIERVDAATQRVWVGDVGQNEREEVDIVAAGGNYGWDCFEGTRDLRETAQAAAACDTIPASGFTPPVAEYDHALGRSITGGYVYRGDRLAGDLTGRYVYGDFTSGRIWAFDPGTGDNDLLVDSDLNISTFGTGADGELYIGAFSSGFLYRLAE